LTQRVSIQISGYSELTLLRYVGLITLADAIKGMKALTSLNLSSNDLKAEGAKIVAEAIKVANCAIAVVLVLIACPSDHWLNCCCLLLSTG
jgi:hypothetical protein